MTFDRKAYMKIYSRNRWINNKNKEEIYVKNRAYRKTEQNLVVACKFCNSSKRTQELDKWFTTKYCIINNICWETVHQDIRKRQSLVLVEVSP
jgi:hypothetical protein